MVACLLDTVVIVDVLRKYAPALDWLKDQPEPGITSVVWMEIIEGAWDRAAQEEAVKVLRDFELVPIMQQDLDWAVRQMLKYQLSHQIGMADALIAAVSHRLDIPLYTPNLKHYSPMLGNLATKPY